MRRALCFIDSLSKTGIIKKVRNNMWTEWVRFMLTSITKIMFKILV